MANESKYKFTDALFNDRVSWNYLKYDYNKKCIDVHILHNKKRVDPEEYSVYLNIVDTNVEAEVKDNKLFLYFDNGNCNVEIEILEKRGFFRTKKYIRSTYNYLPRKITCFSQTKIEKKIVLVGDENWDIIAKFINQVFE